MHETAYGFHNPHDAIEIINLRLTARGRLHEPVPSPASGDMPGAPAAIGTRSIWFSSDAPQDTPIFARESLGAGQAIDGPAVIEQLDTTTLVYPGDAARVDDEANIVITINQTSGAAR